jgi:hypothetical protein
VVSTEEAEEVRDPALVSCQRARVAQRSEYALDVFVQGVPGLRGGDFDLGPVSVGLVVGHG